MTKPVDKKNVLMGVAWAFWACVMALLISTAEWPPGAFAEDGAGAYTARNAVAEGYHSNKEIAAIGTAVDGSDTLTGLEDPESKFGSARIFRLKDTSSQSDGTKPNLKIQLKFDTGGANATVWVVYYYSPSTGTYHVIALKQPLGGTITATAAQEGALFLAPVAVADTYGATHCVVFATAVSAGTAATWLGSY